MAKKTRKKRPSQKDQEIAELCREIRDLRIQFTESKRLVLDQERILQLRDKELDRLNEEAEQQKIEIKSLEKKLEFAKTNVDYLDRVVADEAEKVQVHDRQIGRQKETITQLGIDLHNAKKGLGEAAEQYGAVCGYIELLKKLLDQGTPWAEIKKFCQYFGRS